MGLAALEPPTKRGAKESGRGHKMHIINYYIVIAYMYVYVVINNLRIYELRIFIMNFYEKKMLKILYL